MTMKFSKRRAALKKAKEPHIILARKWKKASKLAKTGMGKAMIWGGVAGLAIKGALGYGLYKAGQSKGRKEQPKKYMAG